MTERQSVIRRLFTRAAERLGSAAYLARKLGITYVELRDYLQGEAMPPEQVLLDAVQIIIDELPAIRTQVSPELWESLRLPK